MSTLSNRSERTIASNPPHRALTTFQVAMRQVAPLPSDREGAAGVPSAAAAAAVHAPSSTTAVGIRPPLPRAR